MAELIPGLSYAEFVAATQAHQQEASFRASPFFARWGTALQTLRTTPRIEPAVPASGAPGPGATPATRGASRSLRIVQWNIEKGKQLERIRRRLREDPQLRDADVYCLNEVDNGTARAGNNADVARVLAADLGCHSVYVPSYLECTKGILPDEREAPGENALGMHGLAILTRHPVLDARSTELPACFDYFDFAEKRLGGRQGLFALLDTPLGRVVIGTTHLEVRNTPRCRARQFGAFLDGLDGLLETWGRECPVVITGDWNTNSFRRGTFAHSAREFLRIVRTSPDELDAELAWPIPREPLFDALEASRFVLGGLNDRRPTAAQVLGSAEDLETLPAPLARYLTRRFGLGSRELRMRLDWIAGRGVRPAAPPLTLAAPWEEPEPPSDHAVLVAECAPLAL